MGGRGTFASGNPVPYTYKIVGNIDDAKILEGVAPRYHSLPEESHKSNKYIKLNDGSFKQLRIYDNKHNAIMDIDYHYEGNLKNNSDGKVLHYHLFDENFNRTDAIPISKELYDTYKKYMKGVRL
jgi:hypothetical protein